MLDSIPAEVAQAARACGVLYASVVLCMDDGTPLCAAVRPPRITWTVPAPA